MRSETWQLATKRSPVVLLTGDSGTGKTSVLNAAQNEYSATALSPAPVACLFDSGALQVALLDALSAAIALHDAEESGWRQLGNRIIHASRETSQEMGKSLCDALVQELLNLVKSRLGQDVGNGLLTFVKGLRNDDRDSLRRDIRSRSDGNVVRLLVRLADEVADVLDQDIVVSLDDVDRLGEVDQRILASIAAQPPHRVRVIVAYSTVKPDALTAIDQLRALNCPEVVVAGLSCGDVDRWLTAERVDTAMGERIYELSQGYPLLVEGLIVHIQAGGSLEEYEAPTVFTAVLNDALQRLPHSAHRAARELSAFKAPLADRDIPAFLGIDALDWGIARSALEAERILTVERATGKWFHEARRAYLWESVLSDDERGIVGQKAYQKLLRDQQASEDAVAGSGLSILIAELASYARDSQAANPQLAPILGLSTEELGVLAAAIELEGTGLASPTPVDQVVIHAHTAFGTPREAALAALPALGERGLLELQQVGQGGVTPSENTGVMVSLANDEVQVVAHGRIQSALGKSAIPHLADHVVRTHLDNVRLESYRVISQAGYVDAYAMYKQANHFRAPIQLRRVGDPILGIWLDLGEQPMSIVAIFNETTELSVAEREVAELTGESFGRRLSVKGTFVDPTHTIPTWRLVQVLYYVTGRPVEVYRDKQWVLEGIHPLSPIECARRQIDALSVLRTELDPVEREVLGLSQPGGLVIAAAGDTTYIATLRGTDQVIELDPAVFEAVESSTSLQFARLEQAIAPGPGVSIGTVTVQRRPNPRVNDPVVEDFGRLWRRARDFNLRQPRTRISIDPDALTAALTSAHRRDMRLVQRLAERVTVGDQRGRRDPRSLRIAIGTAKSDQPFATRMAVSAHPAGDLEDVQVRFVDDAYLRDGAALYAAAFGAEEPGPDFYEAPALSVIASVLGFLDDEINFVA